MPRPDPADRDDPAERFPPHDERAGEAQEDVGPIDALESTPEPDNAETAAQGAALAAVAGLEHHARSGANWFYWVAALSVVNSAILLGGGDRHFVIGLAVTMIVDGIANGIAQQAPDNATLIRGTAIGMDAVIVVVVLLFGWLSNRRYSAIFAVGMFLYLLDGLLFILFEDWFSIAFHAFALYGMWKGFAACRQLNALFAQGVLEAA
jgi:hypothetical protein